MIGVFVTFRYGDDFDEQRVRKIAQNARAKFEGMAGLRSKAFTINAAKREALNFYVWDSEDAAKGNTVGGAKKSVKLETGVTVMAPIFVKVGEVISVNPETGEYTGRE